MYTTLIEPAELAAPLSRSAGAEGDWTILDCRFDLARPDWGASAYAAGHVPKALYAHLDHDLSGPVTATSGRHPLPSVERLAETFGRWGIDDTVQVVAYDQGNGAYAARLWWLLRWLGHRNVAVLNGGFAAWQQAGLPTEHGARRAAAASLYGATRGERGSSARLSSSGCSPPARSRASGNQCWWTPAAPIASPAKMKRSTQWPVTSRVRATIPFSATSTPVDDFCQAPNCGSVGRRHSGSPPSARSRCAARA